MKSLQGRFGVLAPNNSSVLLQFLWRAKLSASHMITVWLPIASLVSIGN